MSKNEFEMDFKKSFFFRGEIWKRVWKMTVLGLI